MSFRIKLMLIFCLSLALVVTVTAGVLGWHARSTLLAEAERDGALIARLLARSAGAAERIPDRVEALLGDQMVAQAELVAELIAAAESAAMPTERIQARLKSVVDRTVLDEIWVTDSFGHAYLNSAGVPDFVFDPDPDKQPQASAFWGLLSGDAERVIQEAQKRETDERVFKYVGVSGVDQPRIVEVGMEADHLAQIEREIGLEFMVESLIEGGDINAIWVFSRQLEALAWGNVLGATRAQPPGPEERRLLEQVFHDGQTLSRFQDGQLVVVAPIPGADGATQGVTLLRLSMEAMRETQQRFIVITVLVGMLVLLVGLLAAVVISRRMTADIGRIAEVAGHIESGRFELKPLAAVARRRDELGQLAEVFAKMAEQVDAREAWLDAQVKARTRELEEKNLMLAQAHETLQKELHIARTLQLAILPSRFPNPPGITIHGRMRPAKEMGGDFYDVFSLDASRIGLVVADVSGKGIPAAFFMAISRTELQLAALRGRGPGDVLAEVNTQLCGQNPLEMFVTVFYGIYDTRTGILTYANGGHNPPVQRTLDGRVSWLPVTHGTALGILEDLPYQENRVAIAPGETLLLYTDGVTEAMDAEGVEFGEERLSDEMVACSGASAEAVIDRIFAAVDAYAGAAEQSDDLTALALCRPDEGTVDGLTRHAVTVRPRRTALTTLMDTVAGFAGDAGLDSEAQRQLELVVEELFMNVVEQGYPENWSAPAGGEVKLSLAFSQGDFYVVMEDDGKPFDPRQVPPPNLTTSLEDRDARGLGMHLVRQLVEEVLYEHREGRNRISLRAPLGSGSEQAD
ncbi:MAG: ATP-binding SpoIIE family protein phosphatase [Halothiobacillaceae bacterium]